MLTSAFRFDKGAIRFHAAMLRRRYIYADADIDGYACAISLRLHVIDVIGLITISLRPIAA